MRRAAFAILACLSTVPAAAQNQRDARIIALEIERRSVKGPDVVAARPAGVVMVRQGESVELRWTSDEPATVHLHGYDIETAVDPGRTAIMRFHARATGRFPIEAHGDGVSTRHRTLVYIEVRPD